MTSSFWHENYNFAHSNFSCLFVGKFFNGNVKIYFICQLLLYRQYGKISHCKVLILDQ